MAIPTNAIKIVLSGALPYGEQWSSSFWVAGTHPLDVTELTNVLTDINTQFNVGGGVYAKLALYNPNTVTLPFLRGYQYQGGSAAAVTAQLASSFTPGSATLTLPNQCAMVLTELTNRPGRSYRGRMYLPILSGSAVASGKWGPTVCDAVAGAFATAFGAFNNIGDGKVSVMSSRTSAITQVSSLYVDDVIDTQRRRAQSITPVKHSASVAP